MSARPKSDLLQGTLDLLLLQIVALQSLHGYAIAQRLQQITDRKSTRLNSSHLVISYAVFCLKKKTGPEAAHAIHVAHPLLRRKVIAPPVARQDDAVVPAPDAEVVLIDVLAAVAAIRADGRHA